MFTAIVIQQVTNVHCCVLTFCKKLTNNSNKKMEGKNTRKATTKHLRDMTFSSFIDVTTLHGLRGACDGSYSLLRRVVWCLILVVMTGVLMMSVGFTVDEYLQ